MGEEENNELAIENCDLNSAHTNNVMICDIWL